MADGTTKDIKDVAIGDTVLATDPVTGEQGPRTVTNTIVGTGDKTLVDVTINNATITATDHHPFYNTDTNSWIDAQDLKPGNHVREANGTTATVDAAHMYVKRATVNNLTIDDLHTYYVMAGDASVLVHNSGCGDSFSEHALRRIEEKGIADEHINEALQATPFPYWHEGQWKSGYVDSGRNLLLGRAGDGTITTVIKNPTKQYLKNLMRARP